MSHENTQVIKVPSLSEIKDTVVTFVNTQWNRLERNVEKRVLNPVNNYLKTPEEIEAELSYQVNFQRAALTSGLTGSFVQLVEYKDGYINIHDPEIMKQGFMEENY
ncbi:MAG: hypothetical protein DI535_12255 [Citrobacter freundii]|nr:MAG: hypothetical protein DI535_12255 [Citrobacter freundii]